MRRLYPLILSVATCYAVVVCPISAKADFWGGDLPLLAQILSNALQQLATLQQMMNVAKGDSDLLSRVNRDIEKALTDVHAMQDIVRDTTDLGKIKNPQELIVRLRDVYGRLPSVGILKDLDLNDQIAGGGMGVDNDTHLHAQKIDDAGISYQNQARKASPGRAQQLIAQSQSTVLHALAQIERSQGTAVRVSSAQLALENSREKAKAESFDQGYSAMMISRASDSSDLTLGGHQ